MRIRIWHSIAIIINHVLIMSALQKDASAVTMHQLNKEQCNTIVWFARDHMKWDASLVNYMNENLDDPHVAPFFRACNLFCAQVDAADDTHKYPTREIAQEEIAQSFPQERKHFYYIVHGKEPDPKEFLYMSTEQELQTVLRPHYQKILKSITSKEKYALES